MVATASSANRSGLGRMVKLVKKLLDKAAQLVDRVEVALEKAEATSDEARGAAPNSVLSFPKSGKTWLSHLYVYYGVYRLLGKEADAYIDEELGMGYRIEEQQAFLRLLPVLQEAPLVPRIEFWHAFPKRGDVPYFNLRVPLGSSRSETVLFLARDPRDIVVSYFHHVRAKKKVPLAEDADISEFIRSESLGIRSTVAYMNQVISRAPEVFPRFEVVHYEDLLADTPAVFFRVLSFFKTDDIDERAIEKAVQRASFQTLQQAERNGKLRVGKPSDDDSLRFRKGKQGSFKTELTSDDIAFLDRIIINNLTSQLERYRQPSI